MSKKGHPNPKRQAAGGKAKEAQGNADRTSRIMNSITNTSIVLMSAMMGGFAQSMIEATGEVASQMAESVDPDEGQRMRSEMREKLPEVDEEMKNMVSEVRKDLYAQTAEKRKDIEPLISDPVFDQGPKILDRYDFGLPKLSEELDDASLAEYVQLLVSEDAKFSAMFQELTDWINSLPKLPEKSVGE